MTRPVSSTTRIFRSRRSFLTASMAGLAAVAAIRAPARPAQFEFKCATPLSSQHPAAIGLQKMWTAIEQESGGRIHTQFFANSALGGEAAMISQVRLGAVPFALFASGTLSSIVPSADVGNLGFAFKESEEGLRVMDGPVGAYIRNEVTAKSLHAFRTIWESGMAQISSSARPINTPADLRAFKIAVNTSKIIVDLFKALGANPLYMSIGELHTALQTRLIDGTGTPMLTAQINKVYEVQKYINITNHAWSGHWLIANGEAWQSLPPDLQDLVERNNTKFAMAERIDAKATNTEAGAKLRQAGMTLNPVDQTPFRAMLGSYYQEWAGAFGATEWGLFQTSLGRKLT